ncbi:hypothetical protein [Streptomyces sp. NPDC006784]|uniref:hypothetical protein n=1 Tax=Streptomyces sp. NPDC006784 TaxID=3364764 RepID=UPI0036923481
MPPDTAPHTAVCSYTHLFRGASVRIQELSGPKAYAENPRATGLVLRFADGAATDAEILISSGGEAVLVVSGHTTRAGTRLPERTWLVRGFRALGDEVEVTVGVPTE